MNSKRLIGVFPLSMMLYKWYKKKTRCRKKYGKMLWFCIYFQASNLFVHRKNTMHILQKKRNKYGLKIVVVS